MQCCVEEGAIYNSNTEELTFLYIWGALKFFFFFNFGMGVLTLSTTPGLVHHHQTTLSTAHDNGLYV